MQLKKRLFSESETEHILWLKATILCISARSYRVCRPTIVCETLFPIKSNIQDRRIPSFRQPSVNVDKQVGVNK